MSYAPTFTDPADGQYAAPSDKPVDLSYSHGQGSAHVHVTSPFLLLGVYGILVLFTILTVAVAYFNFGSYNLIIALAIAVAKGAMVVMYFMHLRWDSPFHGIILIAALFFVALFIGIAILDSHEYQQNYTPPGAFVRP